MKTRSVLLTAALAAANLMFLQFPGTGLAAPLDAWHVRQSPILPTHEDLEGVAYGNGRWVVVGNDGSILSSSNGADWEVEVNPVAPARLDDVVFGNGTFVAIGPGSGTVLTSPDGRQWSKQSPRFSGSMEVIFDGTRFVSVLAGGFVVTSINGADWVSQKNGVPLHYDVGGIAFGNGVYVEAGYKRTGTPPDLFSSTDLLHWDQRDSKLSENLMNVCFGLGQFIAVGQKGVLSTSLDGVEWTPRTVPHTGFIWDVCAGGKYLVAAAQWGRVLTSENGIDWTRHETGLDWHLTDVAFGNGTFVAVGWDGQIVQSDPIELPPGGSDIVLLEPRVAGNQIAFKFAGEAGKRYEVQISQDLKNWAPLTSITCTQTPVNFVENISSLARSYRVVRE